MSKLLLFLCCLLFSFALWAAPTAKEIARGKQLFKEASQAYTQGDSKSALDKLQEALTLLPDNPDLLLLQGQIHYNLRNYQESLDAYQKSLAAGVKANVKKEVARIVEELQTTVQTRIEVEITNGPAEVYLDTKADGITCVASPSCTIYSAVGDHKLIVEKTGYIKFTEKFALEAKSVHKTKHTMLDLPSPLIITSNPEGAEVSVDGKVIGPAPQSLKVPGGEHKIDFMLVGYESQTFTVVAKEGGTITQTVKLRPTLQVELSPSHIELFLNGNKLPIKDGKITLEERIPEVPYVLQAKAKGYYENTVTVPLAFSLNAKLPVTLVPKGAMLTIKGAPNGSTVTVDDVQRGKTPLSGTLDITPGIRTLAVQTSGYFPYYKSLRFDPDTPMTLTLDMEKRNRRKTWSFLGGSFASVGAVFLFGTLSQQREKDFTARAAEPGVISDPNSPNFDPELKKIKGQGELFALIGKIFIGASVGSASLSGFFFFQEAGQLSDGKVETFPNP